MRIATIDIGTNTFNLLIASIENQKLKIHHLEKEFVFLGKGGINKNQLQPDAIERGLNCISNYVRIAKEYGCKEIYPIATSAVRNAENGNDFVQLVKEQFDIQIQVIPGSKEAELIYEGAKAAFDFGEHPVLLMDIGGGSTEFIICDKEQIFWKRSFEVGAARLFEGFHKTDPILDTEIKQIEQHLAQHLPLLIEEGKKYGIQTLIGSSGAPTSFAKIIAYKKGESKKLERTSHYEILLDEFKEIGDYLVNSPLEERIKTPGLISERAPMIVVGTVLVNFIVEQLGITRFHLARYALKEGAATKLLKGKIL